MPFPQETDSDPTILAQIGASSKGEVCRAKDTTPAVIQALQLDQFCSDLRYADSAAQIFSVRWIMTDRSVLLVLLFRRVTFLTE